MLSSLVCGSFHDQEDEELELLRSCSSTKKSSRKLRRRHSFGTKNPYADRGLDKFSALLAELDSKRQKIYTQKGSEDISLLGFAYTNSSDYKPIVVRVRDKKPIKTTLLELKKPIKTTLPSDSQVSNKLENSKIESNKNQASSENKFKYYSNIKIENLRRPSYYVPLTIILILLFLAIFGKSFAILCVSIGWYIIPTIRSDRRPIKTKDNKLKNVANSKPSSPTSVLTGNKSPPQHGSPMHPTSFL